MTSVPGATMRDLKDPWSARRERGEPASVPVTAEAAAGAGHQGREVSKPQGSIYTKQYRLRAPKAREQSFNY